EVLSELQVVLPVIAEVHVLDTVSDEDRILLAVELRSRVQASGIENDAIARVCLDPLGVLTDEILAAQAGEDGRRAARAALHAALTLAIEARRPMTAFHQAELELAILEALEIDPDARDSIRLARFIPVGAVPGVAIHAVTVPGERGETQ